MIVDGSVGRTSNICYASPNAARTAKGDSPFRYRRYGYSILPPLRLFEKVVRDMPM